MLNRDTIREILFKSDNETVLNFCITNKNNSVNICDDEFFHSYLLRITLTLLKSK
jgi:hypothetical protein